MTRDDLAWFRDVFIGSWSWRTARRGDHAYIVCKQDEPGRDAFERAVKVIRRFGHPETFYNSTFIYLTVGDHKYWTMGSPMHETWIINRADATMTYGQQRAPKWNPTLDVPIYTDLAVDYDARYDTPTCHAEDDQIARWLRDIASPYLVDVGCGTGLLIDLLRPLPGQYLGLDPARGMLNELLRKHPHHHVQHTRWEDFDQPLAPGVTVVSLYGSPSYIDQAARRRLTATGRYFLMFYRDGYLPDYHPAGFHVEPPDPDMFGALTPFSNYLIATRREDARP